MKLSLLHDRSGPRLLHADTGELFVGARAVRYEARITDRGTTEALLTVELFPARVEVDGNSGGHRVEFRMEHPKTGRMTAVKSVTFADGSAWEAAT
ncbi:MAG: hypothetical protein ACK51F_10525 [Rhodospirillales bacterium]